MYGGAWSRRAAPGGPIDRPDRAERDFLGPLAILSYMASAFRKRFALVLGGGGLKGFAHIGVLRALRERGLVPSVYAGTSIGALISAAHAGGMTVEQMAQRAHALRRRDLFRLNHIGMLLDRLRSPSIYAEEPLRMLCESVAPAKNFDELPVPVLVNTVDVERGSQVVWGCPGLRNVPVADAVYASCALPGFFPPGRVDGRLCIDGGTIDNLPVNIAALGMDALIAVDVGNADLTHATDVHTEGFSAVFMRAASLMMRALQLPPLEQWQGPPMILIRPRVGHIGWFSFSHTDELIAEGYRAACEALEGYEAFFDAPGGVYPRRRMRVLVDRARCTGCGACVALAPRLMALDASRKAFTLTNIVEWSPADGDFIRHCPTGALTVQKVA
jgi:NTE family protein